MGARHSSRVTARGWSSDGECQSGHRGAHEARSFAMASRITTKAGLPGVVMSSTISRALRGRSLRSSAVDDADALDPEKKLAGSSERVTCDRPSPCTGRCRASAATAVPYLAAWPACSPGDSAVPREVLSGGAHAAAVGLSDFLAVRGRIAVPRALDGASVCAPIPRTHADTEPSSASDEGGLARDTRT